MERRIACVGSRDLRNLASAEFMKMLGSWIVRQGLIVRSGNAQGSDQAFQHGGSKVDPTKVEVCVPRSSYNMAALVAGNIVITEHEGKHYDLAREHHPAWHALNQFAIGFMIRNAVIVEGSYACIANPAPPVNRGGTRHSMRIAKALGLQTLDVSSRRARDHIEDLIEAGKDLDEVLVLTSLTT